MRISRVEHAPRFLATSQSRHGRAMKAGTLRRDLLPVFSGATLACPCAADRVDGTIAYPLARIFLERS